MKIFDKPGQQKKPLAKANAYNIYIGIVNFPYTTTWSGLRPSLIYNYECCMPNSRLCRVGFCNWASSEAMPTRCIAISHHKESVRCTTALLLSAMTILHVMEWCEPKRSGYNPISRDNVALLPRSLSILLNHRSNCCTLFKSAQYSKLH